jgi:hypothetical protein
MDKATRKRLEAMAGSSVVGGDIRAALAEIDRQRAWMDKAALKLRDLHRVATDPVVGELVQELIHGGEWAPPKQARGRR